MKNKTIARAMIAVMLAGSLPAMAQDRDYRDHRDDRAQEQRREEHRDYRDDRAQEQRREEHRDYRHAQREERREYRQERREARRDYREDRREERREARGAGPRHDLYRGQRLPSNYHNRQYVVDNWRAHRLSAPPRGYHWVQVGGDYVLAAVATGIIANILLGN